MDAHVLHSRVLPKATGAGEHRPSKRKRASTNPDFINHYVLEGPAEGEGQFAHHSRCDRCALSSSSAPVAHPQLYISMVMYVQSTGIPLARSV